VFNYNALKTSLDELAESRDSRLDLLNDPIRFPKRCASPHDQEVIALYSALLAYGRVSAIGASIEIFIERAGAGCAQRIKEDTPEEATARFEGFVYRFTRGADLAKLWVGLGGVLRRYGSIGEAFSVWDQRYPHSPSLLPHLTHFFEDVCSESEMMSGGRGFNHFFSDPKRGSALKRFNLFLRWMVRPADGVDLGVWSHLGAHRLLIPLDAHVFRTSRALGLTRRKTPNLKAVKEVTYALQQIAPLDPLRYDFPLAHLGISGACQGRRIVEVCYECSLKDLCRLDETGDILAD
jgi:uncharacterized protein (TIGR02757 family)